MTESVDMIGQEFQDMTRAVVAKSKGAVGLIVGDEIWDHILYRADVTTSITPEGILRGYSGFLGLPVAVDSKMPKFRVDIIMTPQQWDLRLETARQVAPRPAMPASIIAAKKFGGRIEMDADGIDLLGHYTFEVIDEESGRKFTWTDVRPRELTPGGVVFILEPQEIPRNSHNNSAQDVEKVAKSLI